MGVWLTCGLNSLLRSQLHLTPPDVALVGRSVGRSMRGGRKQPGRKYDDYWESAKMNLLNKAQGFMDMLVNYDKDNIRCCGDGEERERDEGTD